MLNICNAGICMMNGEVRTRSYSKILTSPSLSALHSDYKTGNTFRLTRKHLLWVEHGLGITKDGMKELSYVLFYWGGEGLVKLFYSSLINCNFFSFCFLSYALNIRAPDH